MEKRVYWLLPALLLAAVPGGAMEVPAVTPADFGGTEPAAHWLWILLASPAFLSLLAWLAKFLDQWLRERRWLKQYAIAGEIYKYVGVGVDQTWKTLVRGLKEGRENDGKLTEEEKNRALAAAKSFAIDYAAQEGMDLVKVTGPHMLELLIEKTIGDRKSGKIHTGPFPPLPDLAP